MGKGAHRHGGLPRIAVDEIVVVTDDPAPRAIRQDRGENGRSRFDELLIPEHVEECLVVLDRAAERDVVLMIVSPRTLKRPDNPGCVGSRIAFVRPQVCIQCGVLDVPDRAAVVIVRSRFRLDLDLSIAAAHFRVHRRQDHFDFADQVGVHLRRRLESVGPPLVVHADAVALYIHIAGADSGEVCLLRTEDFVERQKGSPHDANQVEHVVAQKRQILDLLFRQNSSNR